MKKLLLSILLIFSTILVIGQDKDRKAEKEIDNYYFEATNDYFVHEYDSAIYKLDILDFLYEDNSNIKFFLGMCYFFKGDFKTAIEYYENSLENVIYTMNYQNGKYAPHIVYFYLGYSYEKIGDKQSAIYSYNEFIKFEKKMDIILNTNDKIQTLKLLNNIE
jgi:tetratricopeptide (TPR) repeat protein